MKVLFGSIIFLAAATTASAEPTTKLEWLLQEFDQNPAIFMEKQPAKRRSTTNPTVQKFSQEEVEQMQYVMAKNKTRPQQLSGRAAMEDDDLAADLVDAGPRLIKSLEKMDQKKLLAAKLKESPWSDFYWPLYTGQLAFRFADEAMPNSTSWKKNADYILKSLNSDPSSSLDKLSPAEKYDLLVGDEKKTLTHAALDTGKEFYDESGKVETWMGICHGWSPAAYMMERPRKAIKVTAADGKTKITFFPSDIKALASLLWANETPDTRFIGGRCNTKKPKKDANGRVEDQECFDTNPGTWHMAVVNQIGVSKRSFVIDATYDYEVWNQPVFSYKYKYFNPQTLKEVDTLEEATVAIEDFKKDKFKKHRSDKAVAVVGISMDMGYVVETQPSTKDKDSMENDEITQVEYQYDLELDAKGNIVGGEWYTNKHPDFLWTPAPDDRAVTDGDRYLARYARNDKWNGKFAMPNSWMTTAAKTSKEGTPLAVVVETLIDLANVGL